MAKDLQNKTNVLPPNGDFPSGDIINDSGVGDGTPVTKNVYGDFHQFFAKLLRDATTAPTVNFVTNDLFDNTSNGFQLNEALALVAAFDFQNATVAPAEWPTIEALQTVREFDGVRIRGIVQFGNNSGNTVATGIPVSHRPVADRIIPLDVYRSSSDTIVLRAHAVVTTSGNIIFQLGNYTLTLLDRLIFDGGNYRI